MAIFDFSFAMNMPRNTPSAIATALAETTPAAFPAAKASAAWIVSFAKVAATADDVSLCERANAHSAAESVTPRAVRRSWSNLRALANRLLPNQTQDGERIYQNLSAIRR